MGWIGVEGTKGGTGEGMGWKEMGWDCEGVGAAKQELGAWREAMEGNGAGIGLIQLIWICFYSRASTI